MSLTGHLMTYINPITGAALPGALAQEQVASDKARQVRRREAAGRNVAAGDRFERSVESPQAVSPISDPPPREREDRRRRTRQSPADDARPDKETPPDHIDVTA